jgi:poly(3-hydroxybutyrate) depolymerase
MPDDLRRETPSLPGYGIQGHNHSVSGLSSGAFMAVQLHLAHSACFTGAGIIAGGPYRCADSFRGAAPIAEDACMLSALYIAMSPLSPAVAPKPARLAALARTAAAAGKIDPIALAKHRLYIFTGTMDKVLSPIVVESTYAFYRALGVLDENIQFIKDVPAGHSILTANPEDSRLGANQPPYLNYSGDHEQPAYMQSHRLLRQIHPDLTNEPAKQLTGELIRFDQSEFVDGAFGRASMHPFGYVYVPGAVLRGEPAAAVHIALHGCKQGFGYVNYVYGRADTANQPPYGNRYVTTTGYNSFAESNKIVVLYPQAIGDDATALNPDGCWDWWGYTDPGAAEPDYHSKQAVQIKAIYRMLERLCSGDPPARRAAKNAAAAPPAAAPAEVTSP